MGLSILALIGVTIAFGFAYISTLRGSARQASALRFALSLPLFVVSLIAAVNPGSVFSLRAIGVNSGVPLTGLSLYPQGSDAIEDLTLSFVVTQPQYWSLAACAIALFAVVSAWRTYRYALRAQASSRAWSVSAHLGWLIMWGAFLSQVPVNFGTLDGGEAGIKAFLSLNAQDVAPSSFVIPQESWIYAPEQWYLVLVALISSILSLISLCFKSSALSLSKTRPIGSAIGALLVLVALSIGFAETGLRAQSCLWMATMLLSAASFLKLPAMQHHVVLISSLVVLVGLY